MAIGWHDRLAAVVIGTAVLLLPLVFDLGAKETFRTPKDLAYRAAAILVAGLAAAGWATGSLRVRLHPAALRRQHAHVVIVAAIIAWAIITTLLSTNRLRSSDSLITVLCSAVLFFATVRLARQRGFTVIALLIAAAVVNAVIVILQEFDIWRPFVTGPGLLHHLRSTALIGNPNDVGGYLAGGTLAAIATAMAVSGTRRLAASLAATVIAAGLLVTQTATAIVACAIGVTLLFALRSWKPALLAAITAILLLSAAVMTYPPFRERAHNVQSWIAKRDYNALSTDRLAAFTAALLMVRDHPVTGVGPGCFAWQYFPYKLQAENDHPFLRNAYNRGTNFTEAHNDHLQVAAETGIVGYLLLLGALIVLGRRSFVAAPADSQRSSFARMTALPLAVCFVVLALAQFPLELTAVRSVFEVLAAFCIGWSKS